jgi:hypothetical protein
MVVQRAGAPTDRAASDFILSYCPGKEEADVGQALSLTARARQAESLT